MFSTGSYPLAVFHWQFSTGSFSLAVFHCSFRFGGHFWRGSPVGLNQKVRLRLGVFAAGHCKLVSPAQVDGKICSISQKQVCFVSAVAEGCSLNLYFNVMKCNWNTAIMKCILYTGLTQNSPACNECCVNWTFIRSRSTKLSHSCCRLREHLTNLWQWS